jgi:hypothetical protein
MNRQPAPVKSANTAPKPEASEIDEFRQGIEDYANDLRAVLEKLRRMRGSGPN